MKKMMAIIVGLCLVSSVVNGVEPQYETSFVGFDIKQFGLGMVEGSFGEFEVSCRLTDDKISDVRATMNISSIDTKNKTRNRHLQKKEFFYEKKFPVITFVGGDDILVTDKELKGVLTIRGVSVPVVLPVHYEKGEAGNVIITSEGMMLDRFDYGMTSHKHLINNELVAKIRMEFK